MGELFKGWKRKVGFATLCLACALVAVWVRSLLIRDEIILVRPDVLHAFASASGTVRWGKATNLFDGDNPIMWRSRAASDEDSHDDYWQQWDNEWRIGWAGFDFGAGDHRTVSSMHIERWAIPYWFIVIPLTLLSACLLLSKPPKRSSIAPAFPATSEPTQQPSH